VTWLETAIDKANEPIAVDVSHLNLDVKEITVLPLSANEYQMLKNDPELRNLTLEDRTERLGLRMVFEMMRKCDDDLNFTQFLNLPLNTIGELSNAVMDSLGISGGGALGE